MAESRPQYYENPLTPLSINPATLAESLHELRTAIRNGAKSIHANAPMPDTWGLNGMFKSFPGIALALLRLDYQSPVLTEEVEGPPDYRQFALQRIPSSLPEAPLLPSRLSPIGSSSPLTAVLLRFLATMAKANWKDGTSPGIASEDIGIMQEAMKLALANGPLVAHDGRRMGGDDMLFGRPGLLWMLLNIRAYRFNEETQKALLPIMQSIPQLLDMIIDAGRQGSKDYTEKHGEQEAHPLMYAWMEGYYFFGAVHGITGILSILLSCTQEELAPYLPVIGETVTALCKLSIENNGHLPMALPPFSYGQASEFVQLCHGSPGLLILLAAALKNGPLTQEYWCPEWDQVIYLATGRIWEEGLLSKGGSLCHGIAGNGWPWLLLHDSFEYHSKDIDRARQNYLQRNQVTAIPDTDLSQKLTPDFFLSRALAFMLHARETRPYNTSPFSGGRDYRMPDDPYSMFEGLAGNACAWADTCATLQARLRQHELSEQGLLSDSTLETDAVFQDAMRSQLGFPAIGGNGARGVF